MRNRRQLPPREGTRPSPRMPLRADLEADHRHPMMGTRPRRLERKFREFERDRAELISSLLDRQAWAAAGRANSASVVALADILVAGLVLWLTLQAVQVFPQTLLLRVAAAALGVIGLVLAFLSLVFALATIRLGWGESTGDANPAATQFFGPLPPPGAAASDPQAFRDAFLKSKRKDFRAGALQALFLGSRRAGQQESNLRTAAVCLLLSFGSVLVLALVAAIGWV